MLVEQARNLSQYGANAPQEEAIRAETVAFLEKTAAKGSLDSISLLASLYSDGVLFQPDNSKAYAYWSADSKLSGNPNAAVYAEKYCKLLRASDFANASKIEASLIGESCNAPC